MTRRRSSEPDPQLSFLLPIVTAAIEWPDKELEKIFDEWWQKCWKKEAKAHARKAYFSAIRTKGVTPEQLIEGANRYVQFLTRNPSRPAKHPATWLNAECWSDILTDDTRSAARSRTAAFVEAAHSVGAGAAIRRRV